MFILLSRMGYDTVMLWPLMEALPMPLSEGDAEQLRAVYAALPGKMPEPWSLLPVQ